MATKCNDINKLKEILSKEASETNEIGGDSKQRGKNLIVIFKKI